MSMRRPSGMDLEVAGDAMLPLAYFFTGHRDMDPLVPPATQL